MRRLAFFVLIAPVLTHAQTGQILGGISIGIRRAGMIQPLPNRPITDLQGFPRTQESTGTLPKPSTGADSPLLVIDRAGDMDRNGDSIKASGPIEMDFRGYKIFADAMEGNLKTEVFHLKGHVLVIGESGQVKGDTVEVEFKTRFFRATIAKTTLKASSTQGYLLEDLFFDSEESYGTPAEQFHISSSATTCDYPAPHFEIRSRTADVRPKKRAILRGVDLIILKRRVLHLPYLVIPLDRPPDRYIPEFGQSQDEGYFVKSKWGVDSHIRNSDLLARLDYFTKLGNGFGADLGYGKGPSRNTFSFYTLPTGPKMLLITTHHDQFWGRSEFSIDNQFQRNNYLYADNSTYWTSRETISIPQKTGTTQMSYNRSSTDANSFNSIQQTFGFQDNRRFGTTTQALTLNWSRYDTVADSVTQATRQQVDVNFDTQTDFRRAQAEFQYQRSIPIGTTSGFYSTSDQTPVITLRSDARRLNGGKFADEWPYSTDVSFGEFQDPIFGGHIQREAINFALNKSIPTRGRLNSGINTRFQQGFYSDDTAQFNLAYGGQSSYNFAKNSTWNLQYNYQRQQGYSPLSMDQGGRTDYASSDLSYQVLRPLSLGVQTAYDFTARINPFGGTPWQQLGFRSNYAPNENLSVRTTATYDTYNKGWSNLNSDLEYRYGPLYGALGMRYDAERSTFSNANLYLSGLHFGKVGLEARIEYNGYLKQFDAQQYGLVYDLHDAEAVFQIVDSQTGFRPGRTLNFFIRLKALPFNSLFGTGTRGQAIGTGTGHDL